MPNSIAPEKPGIYTLIIHLPIPVKTRVGKLGLKTFPAGYYTYTGSALGKGALSLKERLRRHFGSKRNPYWHIDFLLNSKPVKIICTVISETALPRECQVSTVLQNHQDALTVVKGFGSKDCNVNCESHLHFFPNLNSSEVIKLAMEAHKKAGLSPSAISP